MRWTQTEQDAPRAPGFQVWFKIDVLASSFLDGNSRVQDPHFMQEIQGLGGRVLRALPCAWKVPAVELTANRLWGAEAF